MEHKLTEPAVPDKRAKHCKRLPRGTDKATIMLTHRVSVDLKKTMAARRYARWLAADASELRLRARIVNWLSGSSPAGRSHKHAGERARRLKRA
jgi:hypothetical protein